MKFSVVIPCYNHGHFLTDCLESLAVQTLRSFEVVVVNDGSTDEETLHLLDRLPLYSYPYPLRVLSKPNGGLGSARNHGIRHSTGDVVVPLDSDDKLFPDALAEYQAFLSTHPDVDVCYPDTMIFGNVQEESPSAPFNHWRQTQQNLLLCSSAVRRRVFEQGYWFREDMRRGFEDWEFWIRTCALGPFRAASLGKCVFAYRKWGFSMYSACDHEKLTTEIRALHESLGLWSPAVERTLRAQHAPSHRLLMSAESEAPPWGDDLALLPEPDLERFLRLDNISRFLWVGSVDWEKVPSLQSLLGMAARSRRAPVYSFFQEGADTPYLVVYDRLAWLECQRPGPGCCQEYAAVRLQTGGQRFAWPIRIHCEVLPLRGEIRNPKHEIQNKIEARSTNDPNNPASFGISCFGFVSDFGFRASDFPAQREGGDLSLLPQGWERDQRVYNSLFYYFRRQPVVACPAALEPAGQTLVVAARALTEAEVESPLRHALTHPRLRARFDRIYLLTFEPHERVGHEHFELLVDGIYALGHPLFPPNQQLQAALEVLQGAQASDLLICDCLAGYDLIPRLQQARLRIRLSALLGSAGPVERGGEAWKCGEVLAAHYAALFSRVVSQSQELTDHLTDYLYFPRGKIRTAPTGAVRGNLIRWLFPEEDGEADSPFTSVFGTTQSAARGNPKSEIRNPKQTRSTKHQ